MFIYQAYGLRVHSEFKLFQFPVIDGKQDVLIRRGSVELDGVDKELPYPYLLHTPIKSILFFEGIGTFLVLHGREIVVNPLPDANESIVKRFLLGPAMAILLYQRERLVLHGSGVCINGQGVLFLGGPGAGKSSLVAAHVSYGYPFIVDDVASIELKDNIAWIYPGFPQIKLGPDIADLVTSNTNQFASIDDFEDKKNILINYELCPEKVPLKRIFVLMGDDGTHIERLNQQRSVIEIVRYSIPPSSVKLNPRTHFDQCLELAKCVRVYNLRRSRSLNDFPQLIQAVEDNSD